MDESSPYTQYFLYYLMGFPDPPKLYCKNPAVRYREPPEVLKQRSIKIGKLLLFCFLEILGTEGGTICGSQIGLHITII